MVTGSHQEVPIRDWAFRDDLGMDELSANFGSPRGSVKSLKSLITQRCHDSIPHENLPEWSADCLNAKSKRSTWCRKS